MSTTPLPYANDEDVALRAAADFGLLCPRDQVLAAGADGAFAPEDRWTLRSSGLAAQGLAPGQVVQLLGPAGAFRPPGDAPVIESVAPGAVTLRRRGMAAGVGLPPGSAAGLVGVEYVVATLAPQLGCASDELNRRLGIDPAVAGRRPGDLADPGALRELVVLSVLGRQYLAQSRDAGGPADAFAAKARAFAEEFDRRLARAMVRWSCGAATTAYSTRLAR